MSNLFLCPDDFWRCPIDLNHQVLAKRFPYHIRRCMIANPHIERVRCVFNANHLTKPNDLLNHMSTCPDAINRSTVLIGLSDLSSIRSPPNAQPHRKMEPTEWQMFHDVNATEDWDDDIRQRRAKCATINGQVLHLSEVETSASSPACTSYLHDQSTENVISHRNKHIPLVNSRHTQVIPNVNVSTQTKQAHILNDFSNDGQIHPVETDELTMNLMRIRTLQLIGGAGRGTCCLLRGTSSSFNHPR